MRTGRLYHVAEVRYGSLADISCGGPHVCFVPKGGDVMPLLDHLVGVHKQAIWDGHAQRLGGFKIDEEFNFCRLLYRKFSRVRALKYFIHENSRTASYCNLVGAIRHKRTGLQRLSRPNG